MVKTTMKGLVQFNVALVLFILAVTGTLLYVELSKPPEVERPQDLKTFNSWEEASTFIKLASSAPSPMYKAEATVGRAAPMMQAASSAMATEALPDYSTTNIQVAGVDEADILKNDGRYFYVVSNGQLHILKAYLPSEASLLSTINESGISGLFVNGDKLIVFGTSSYNWEPIVEPLRREFNTSQADEQKPTAGRALAMPVYGNRYGASFVKIYDVSDRYNPVLLKSIESAGSYVSSRMIGDKVYVIFSEPAASDLPRPLYTVDGKLSELSPTQIDYLDQPFDGYAFTTMLGLDLTDINKPEEREIVLMGNPQNIFVSTDNAFITYTSSNYGALWEEALQLVSPFLDNETRSKIGEIGAMNISAWRKDKMKAEIIAGSFDSLSDSQRTELYGVFEDKQSELMYKITETTVIHKFHLGNDISYQGKGEVAGHVLNQFSMDEHNGYFRIATTIGKVSRTGSEQVNNNLYVLDSSLNIVGKLGGLARGEKIYSARFMGDKVYLVTFKKVDPLFVIDASNPTNPQVLGELKIPGYSDYLHPFGENYLIGLGKDAIGAEEGDFAWYQGVKLSLFDVRNVSNPVEIASYKIGDRETESLALHDHKAFLFNPTSGLLVIPISLYEVDNPESSPTQYGEFQHQGAYVFNVSTTGINLNGKVIHSSTQYDYGSEVQRSAYIGNYLYTLSPKLVKISELDTLADAGSVSLPFPDSPIYIVE